MNEELRKELSTCSLSLAFGELDSEDRDSLEKHMESLSNKIRYLQNGTDPVIEKIKLQINTLTDPYKISEAERFMNKRKADKDLI